MTTHPNHSHPANLGQRKIVELWWPLAGSWLLMGLELPAVSAVMARLADPEIHLAAYGGVVFPLSLLIESPVIMLLAASTALSKDWHSYTVLRRFMLLLASSLTGLHVVVAWTPLFDVVASGLLGVPEKILEPARTGLMLMTPWTAAIAIRRFQQGLLIRTGHTRVVGSGTALRLLTNLTVLGLGLALGTIPGIVVGTSAVALGVTVEAIFIHWRVQPLLAAMRKSPSASGEPLTMHQLLTFYIPLALTPLLHLITLPIVSAALSRMPHAIDSLAVWPVLAGLSFTIRSVGLAYQEVVVALLDRPGAMHALRRFAVLLGGTTSGIIILIAATPLAGVWFGDIAALSPKLTSLGERAIWLALVFPAFSVMESFLQGRLLHRRKTRPITEAVAWSLMVTSGILIVGTLYATVTGLYIGLVAAVCGLTFQLMWLWSRSRSIFEQQRTTVPHAL